MYGTNRFFTERKFVLFASAYSQSVQNITTRLGEQQNRT